MSTGYRAAFQLPPPSPPQPQHCCSSQDKARAAGNSNLFFQVCWRWERAAQTRLSRINTEVLGCSSCPGVLWQAGLPSLVLLEVEVLESWEKWEKQQRFEVKQAAPVQPQRFLCFGFLIFGFLQLVLRFYWRLGWSKWGLNTLVYVFLNCFSIIVTAGKVVWDD